MVLGASLLLGGCSYASDVLWPSLTGDNPSGGQQQIAASDAEKAGAPTLGAAAATAAAAPAAASAGQPTGTYVGQKVTQLRAELTRLQQVVGQRSGQMQQITTATTQDSERYHGTVAAITTRLQLGTTPGNPVLVNQWNQAQTDLDRLSADIAAMNSLANDVAADSDQASYLLQAAKAAFGLSGAIDEDHRQIIALEDDTNRTVVTIDRLLNDLSENISRQATYVGNERTNLTALSLAVKNGQLYGSSLMNPGNQSRLSAAPAGARAALDNRQPLVVIRFDRADVPYQQALYTAVSKALQRSPQAAFDIVGVAAGQSSASQAALNQAQSRRNVDKVVRTLTDMGLPPDRLSVSSSTSSQSTSNEVNVYVR